MAEDLTDVTRALSVFHFAGLEAFSNVTCSRIHHYLFLAPLRDEVRYIWNKPKTASSYCFFLNRYLAALGNVVVAVYSYSRVPQSVLKIQHVSGNTPHPESSHNLSKHIIISMLAAAAVLFTVAIWAISSGAGGIPQQGEAGCNIADPRHAAIMIAVTWEALFVYDLIIFGALFYKSFRTRIENGLLWSRIPLLNLLVRDGSIYFAVMATVNLANILTSYIAELHPSADTAQPLLVSCLSSLASNLAVTMMSRLMLNLHAIESVGIFSVSAPTSLDTDLRAGTVELDTLWTRDLERSPRGSDMDQRSVQSVPRRDSVQLTPCPQRSTPVQH
ncbi:hypothetical protein DFH07DRAFT_771818 [Mycena maculata]|uniref:DUF6533 domain-containing protein n=1 Tax=Mycena maculata TaxID=230809 RepID=A0AAD7JD52_9AGAR|nr:hypothetical protein DFH07DRAFT_771818 [Mycena maculata]